MNTNLCRDLESKINNLRKENKSLQAKVAGEGMNSTKSHRRGRWSRSRKSDGHKKIVMTPLNANRDYVSAERLFSANVPGDVKALQTAIESTDAKFIAAVGISEDGRHAHFVAYADSFQTDPVEGKACYAISQFPGYRYFTYAQGLGNDRLATTDKMINSSSELFRSAFMALTAKGQDVRLVANPAHETCSWVLTDSVVKRVVLEDGRPADGFLFKKGQQVQVAAVQGYKILATSPKASTTPSSWDTLGTSPEKLHGRISRELTKGSFIAKAKDGVLYLVQIDANTGTATAMPLMNERLSQKQELVGTNSRGYILIAENDRDIPRQVNLGVSLPPAAIIASIQGFRAPQAHATQACTETGTGSNTTTTHKRN